MGDGISFGFDFNWERNSGTRVFFPEIENISFFITCLLCMKKKKEGAFFGGLKSKKNNFFNIASLTCT